jgi:hypothetical protein
MNFSNIEDYADLWTEGASRYGLIEVHPGGGGGFLIFDLEAKAPLVIDVEPNIYEEIIRRMRGAGVRVIVGNKS